jgi:SPOR domain
MASTTTGDDDDRELGLQDEDRLPWLEAVEDDDEAETVSTAKLAGFVIAALLALGIVVGGVWWLQSQKQPEGDGTLIAAQEGDYKVKPDAPGGMKVEGQGDSTFAASEGAEGNGKVDPGAQPETPVLAQKGPAPATKPVAAAKSAVSTSVPASGGKLTAKPPAAVAQGASGTVIQLGAFPSQGDADAAWKTLASGNAALAKLPKTVVVAKVNGRTYYRLRANAGTAANASAMCAQVGNCMIVR